MISYEKYAGVGERWFTHTERGQTRFILMYRNDGWAQDMNGDRAFLVDERTLIKL